MQPPAAGGDWRRFYYAPDARADGMILGCLLAVACKANLVRAGRAWIVVGVRIFSRKGIEKDDRAKQIEQDELDLMEKNLQDEIRILHEETKKRLVQLLNGRTLRSDLFDQDGRERVLRKGQQLTPEAMADLQGIVASSFTVSADGITYTFKVRPGATFSNGTPVTAKSFDYSYRRAAAAGP